MASANCTLGVIPATIEVDTNFKTATKGNEFGIGDIVNKSATTVFVKYYTNPDATTAAPATTDAQAVDGTFSLPQGTSAPVPRWVKKFSYVVASGTSVLHWFPSNEVGAG